MSLTEKEKRRFAEEISQLGRGDTLEELLASEKPVITMPDGAGREINIYANGRIEGLDALPWLRQLVINRVPLLIEKLQAK